MTQARQVHCRDQRDGGVDCIERLAQGLLEVSPLQCGHAVRATSIFLAVRIRPDPIAAQNQSLTGLIVVHCSKGGLPCENGRSIKSITLQSSYFQILKESKPRVLIRIPSMRWHLFKSRQG